MDNKPTDKKQEWVIYFSWMHKGKTGFTSCVTIADSEEDAKRQAIECLMLKISEVVFWESERVR